MAIDLKARDALADPATSATLLHAIVRLQYGEDWYEWDPLTVAMEIKDDFSLDIPASNLDKLIAIQLLVTTKSFYTELEGFGAICGTLASGDPMFDIFDPASTEELAWGITEAALNREALPFSREIKVYARAVLAQDGYDDGNAPAPFQMVFDPTPTRGELMQGLAAQLNGDNVHAYIAEKLDDLVVQFNAIPSLQKFDDHMFDRGFRDAVTRYRNEGKV